MDVLVGLRACIQVAFNWLFGFVLWELEPLVVVANIGKHSKPPNHKSKLPIRVDCLVACQVLLCLCVVLCYCSVFLCVCLFVRLVVFLLLVVAGQAMSCL